MVGDKDMFRELAENNGPRKYATFGDNSKGKVVGLGKVAISHDNSIQNVMLVESLGYNLLFVSRLADFGFNVLFTEVDCQVFRSLRSYDQYTHYQGPLPFLQPCSCED